jgi:hypothetical protein
MKLSQRNPAAAIRTIPTTPEIRQKVKFNGTNLGTLTKQKNSLKKRPPKHPQKYPENTLKTPQKAPLLPLSRALKPHPTPNAPKNSTVWYIYS